MFFRIAERGLVIDKVKTRHLNPCNICAQSLPEVFYNKKKRKKWLLDTLYAINIHLGDIERYSNRRERNNIYVIDNWCDKKRKIERKRCVGLGIEKEWVFTN